MKKPLDWLHRGPEDKRAIAGTDVTIEETRASNGSNNLMIPVPFMSLFLSDVRMLRSSALRLSPDNAILHPVQGWDKEFSGVMRMQSNGS
jgi:hypothetical protein